MSDDTLRRLAKAIHTLFYKTERAAERYRALAASIEGDDELSAFQALGVGLINFDPPPPEIVAGLRAHMEDVERAADARPTINPRVQIRTNDGAEGRYVEGLLRRMYAAWDGTLDYERGTHRFCFYSPFDPEGRRVTTFAQVAVDGECPDLHARTYVLGPYLRVKDDRTKRESDDPWKVLHGDLTPILPEQAA